MTEVVEDGLEWRKRDVFTAWFVHIAAAILAVTGLAKAWSAFAPIRLLAAADPISGMQFRHLMMAAGGLELIIACVCFFAKAQNLALALIAWLATSFVVYRLGLWWMGWHRPCGCLGNLTDALHISPHAADNIMKGVLAYLLLGSYGILLWQWRASRSAPVAGGQPEVPAQSVDA